MSEPSARTEAIQAWMAKWGATADDVQGVADRLAEMAEFAKMVKDVDPELRIKLQGPAFEELAEIMRSTSN